MGIERDYLMRQIMMLLELIQKILGLRKKGFYKEAEEEINYIYNYLQLKKDVQDMSAEDLIDYLIAEKKFTNYHLEVIAFLFKEQGELEINSTLKLNFFRKAYFLLERADRESTSFSMERQLKLTELRDSLN
jgi:hypothetical protein